MLNIGVGSILTNGLGGPAYNLLTFGPVNLYIEPFDPTPTPTPTPEPSPTPIVPTPTPEPTQPSVGGGAGTAHRPYEEDNEQEERYYKLTLNVKFTKNKSVTKHFIVDKQQQEIIVRRLGKINSSVHKFKVRFNKIKEVFTFKWKR